MPAISNQFPDYGTKSSVYFTGDGSTTDFTYPYDYTNRSTFSGPTPSPYIRVFTGANWEALSETSSFTMPTAGTIRISPAPAVGTCILIRRDSQLGVARQDFVQGGRLNAEQLQEMYKHVWYLQQEANDKLRELSEKINNFSTVGNVYTFTGTGAQTVFTLGTEKGLSAGSVLVTINGAFQDISLYSVADNAGVSKITFNSAPANAATIRVRVLSGGLVSAATPGPTTVDSTSIVAGAVTWPKTNFNGAGSNGQTIVQRSGVATWDTVTAADVTNLQSTINATSLSALAVPSSNLNLNNKKIVSLADPTAATDGATKQYVDTQVSTIGLGGIDGGRVVAGYVTASNTTSSISLGWGFDMLLCFVEGAVSSGNRPVVYSIVYPAAYGNGQIDFLFAAPSAACILRLQRTTNGFFFRLLDSGKTSGIGTVNFSYIAIRNSTVA